MSAFDFTELTEVQPFSRLEIKAARELRARARFSPKEQDAERGRASEREKERAGSARVSVKSGIKRFCNEDCRWGGNF